jgi:hypothetical protein
MAGISGSFLMCAESPLIELRQRLQALLNPALATRGGSVP